VYNENGTSFERENFSEAVTMWRAQSAAVVRQNSL
jgi:hypothetical protein